MIEASPENTSIRFLKDTPDGSFKQGEVLSYTQEKAEAAVQNVKSRYGEGYVEYVNTEPEKAEPQLKKEKEPETVEQPSVFCESCAAAIDESGKCLKCGSQANLKTYGFILNKMKDGTYLLTKKDSVEPLGTVYSLSLVWQTQVKKLTKAPLEAVSATFASLKIQEDRTEEEAEQKKNIKIDNSPKVEQKKYDVTTEAKINEALQKVIEADNQLDALVPHLDNMVIGEDNTKKAVTVLNLSGKCKEDLKQIILFKATEGAGKSTLMRTTQKGYKVKDVGRFSSHALDYTDLSGFEILSLKELGAMDEETQGVSTLKFLSSDDCGYTVEVTVRNEETGRFTTEQHKIPPITANSSTTRLQLDPQFERRAWLFGLDETEEQTKRIAAWISKNKLQTAEKILGRRKLTDAEFSSAVYSRFIQQFKPIDVIIPFPQTLLSTLNYGVLRVRGDLGKLLTFTELYAMLNLKRLEKVTDEIYTLTPEVALEGLDIALKPIAGMLAKVDDRAKILFSALKSIEEVQEQRDFTTQETHEVLVKFDKKGAVINKRTREKVAVKIGKSEKTVRVFLSQLCEGGYVSEAGGEGSKPKTYKLLFDIEEIEKKTAGLLEKSKSADDLISEMRKEAREWIKTSLEKTSGVDGQEIISTQIKENEEKVNNNITPPSTPKIISNEDIGTSQADSAQQSLINCQIKKLPTNQGVKQIEADFLYEEVKPSESCELCGKPNLKNEFKITKMKAPLKGNVILRCEECLQKMKRDFEHAIFQSKGEAQ